MAAGIEPARVVESATLLSARRQDRLPNPPPPPPSYASGRVSMFTCPGANRFWQVCSPRFLTTFFDQGSVLLGASRCVNMSNTPPGPDMGRPPKLWPALGECPSSTEIFPSMTPQGAIHNKPIARLCPTHSPIMPTSSQKFNNVIPYKTGSLCHANFEILSRHSRHSGIPLGLRLGPPPGTSGPACGQRSVAKQGCWVTPSKSCINLYNFRWRRL